ncbi:MAG: proton-conducting transporter membrane subunit [Tetrasphaera sp.]
MSVVSFDWLVLAPALAPISGALLVLVLDILASRASGLHLPVGLVALGAGIGALPFGAFDSVTGRTLCLPAGPDGACFYEGTAWGATLQLIALGASLLVLLLLGPGTGHISRAQRGGPAVTVALVLTATAGAVVVPAVRDLPSWLIAIELATLPAVALVALSRSPGAQRGATALLMTSLTSFGLLAVGLALWVLATGDARFAPDTVAAAWADADHHRALVMAVLFLLAGLGFKLSAVPFHTWTPQAFVPADEAVAALLATTSKVAALGAVVVVVRPFVAPAMDGEDGRGTIIVILAVIALASMTLGNLVALTADDPVRLLAWSTIAQGGWVLLPMAVLGEGGIAAAVTYLLVYAAATLTVFAVAAAAHSGTEGAGERSLAAYRGMGRRQPLLAGALGLGLLTLAGLPPGIAGLFAKIVALRPIVGAGYWLVVAVAVVNVVIGLAVYLRWLLVLVSGGPPPETPRQRLDPGLLAALVLATVVLVVASVVPGLILGLAGLA